MIFWQLSKEIWFPPPREHGQFSLVHRQPIHKNLLVRSVMCTIRTSRAWHFHTPAFKVGLTVYFTNNKLWYNPHSSVNKKCTMYANAHSDAINQFIPDRWHIVVPFPSQDLDFHQNIRTFNIFQVYPVLHYLQAVLFIKICIIFMNIFFNTL